MVSEGCRADDSSARNMCKTVELVCYAVVRAGEGHVMSGTGGMWIAQQLRSKRQRPNGLRHLRNASRGYLRKRHGSQRNIASIASPRLTCLLLERHLGSLLRFAWLHLSFQSHHKPHLFICLPVIMMPSLRLQTLLIIDLHQSAERQTLSARVSGARLSVRRQRLRTDRRREAWTSDGLGDRESEG